jgi:hypothetical protein
MNSNMLKISEFAPYFSKSSFDIKPEMEDFPSKKQIINKKKNDTDYLFFIFYKNVKDTLDTFDPLETYNERDVKIKLAEKLEQMKFKNKDDIMNNLIYDKRIKLITLNMICKLLNVNLIYIYDKLYVNMRYNETKPIVLNYNGRFSSLNDFDLEKLNDMFEINLEKPLKSVSAYKLPELQDISNKIGVLIDKKKKQELYDEIKAYLNHRHF